MYELYNNFDNLYQNRKMELEQNLAAKRKLKDFKNQQKSANYNFALMFLIAFRNLLSR